jgi:hypothetical protein
VFILEKLMSGHSQVGSLSAALEKVKLQTDFSFVSQEERQQFEEICLIIAEVFCLPDSFTVSIGKEKIPISLVREIYSRLSKEHIETVLNNFKKAKYEIRHKKTYFRTALYNVVFEFESHYENQVAKDSAKRS